MHIAEIAHGAKFKRIDAELQIKRPHKARSVADLAGAVPGTGTVGDAEIRGHTDEADIDAGEIPCEGSAHERRYFREAWLQPWIVRLAGYWMVGSVVVIVVHFAPAEGQWTWKFKIRGQGNVTIKDL